MFAVTGETSRSLSFSISYVLFHPFSLSFLPLLSPWFTFFFLSTFIAPLSYFILEVLFSGAMKKYSERVEGEVVIGQRKYIFLLNYHSASQKGRSIKINHQWCIANNPELQHPFSFRRRNSLPQKKKAHACIIQLKKSLDPIWSLWEPEK